MQPPGAEDAEEDDEFEMFGDSAMEGETFYRGNDATLNEIAAQMKGPGGVEVRDRTYRARTYKACFIGQEAVDWLVKTLKLETREEAVLLGQSLMYRGMVEHVCNSEPFADHYFFYRFASDAEKKSSVSNLQIANLTEAEIATITEKMLTPGTGLDIKDRTHHLRAYRDCFIGSDAVTWILKYNKALGLSEVKNRADALQLGTLLVQRGVIHHVANGQPFRDGNFFYRFYVNERKYNTIADKSKAKDILAWLEEGHEPVIEPDSLAWAERMIKLLSQLKLVTSDGILRHGYLNRIWANPTSREEHKLLFLKTLEKFSLSFRYDSRRSLIPRLLAEDPPSHASPLLSGITKSDHIKRELDFMSSLPEHFFSHFLIAYLRFAAPDVLLTTLWRTGLVVTFKGDTKAVVRSSKTTLRVEMSGTPNPRFLTVFMEVSNALIELLKLRSPDMQCSLVPGKSSGLFSSSPPTFSFAACQQAIINGKAEVTNANGKTGAVPKLVPDLLMLDFSPIPWTTLTIEKSIGVGGFAEVFSATLQGEKVAVKKFLNGENLYEFRREAMIMADLQHPLIVSLKAVCNSPPSLIMPFIPFGDLRSLINSSPEKQVPWPMKLRILEDVAGGLEFMHTRAPAVIHKDFKSQNILIASTDVFAPVVAKVTDFGTARYLVTVLNATEVENPVYLAPEVIGKKYFTDKSDVFAFAIVLYELLTGLDPYVECRFGYEIEDAITSGRRPRVPPSLQFPTPLVAILCQAWRQCPLNRPTMRAVSAQIQQLRKKYTDEESMKPDMAPLEEALNYLIEVKQDLVETDLPVQMQGLAVSVKTRSNSQSSRSRQLSPPSAATRRDSLAIATPISPRNSVITVSPALSEANRVEEIRSETSQARTEAVLRRFSTATGSDLSDSAKSVGILRKESSTSTSSGSNLRKDNSQSKDLASSPAERRGSTTSPTKEEKKEAKEKKRTSSSLSPLPPPLKPEALMALSSLGNPTRTFNSASFQGNTTPPSRSRSTSQEQDTSKDIVKQ